MSIESNSFLLKTILEQIYVLTIVLYIKKKFNFQIIFKKFTLVISPNNVLPSAINI